MHSVVGESRAPGVALGALSGVGAGRSTVGLAVAHVLALLLAPATVLHAEESAGPRGVNPRDLVSKLDLLFKRDVFDGYAINSWTLKYDQPISPSWGMAVELPYAEFRTSGRTVRGMSETKLKARHVATDGRLSWVAGGEIVVPTARDPRLGSGTWQFNPSVGAVWMLRPTTFVFGGVQRLQSLDEEAGRAPVRQNQVRMLAAQVSPAGWWLLGDVKYTRDLVARADGLDYEIEYGRMLDASRGVSLRIGTSGLDALRDFGVVVDLRFLF